MGIWSIFIALLSSLDAFYQACDIIKVIIIDIVDILWRCFSKTSFFILIYVNKDLQTKSFHHWHCTSLLRWLPLQNEWIRSCIRALLSCQMTFCSNNMRCLLRSETERVLYHSSLLCVFKYWVSRMNINHAVPSRNCRNYSFFQRIRQIWFFQQPWNRMISHIFLCAPSIFAFPLFCHSFYCYMSSSSAAMVATNHQNKSSWSTDLQSEW